MAARSNEANEAIRGAFNLALFVRPVFVCVFHGGDDVFRALRVFGMNVPLDSLNVTMEGSFFNPFGHVVTCRAGPQVVVE